MKSETEPRAGILNLVLKSQKNNIIIYQSHSTHASVADT